MNVEFVIVHLERESRNVLESHDPCSVSGRLEQAEQLAQPAKVVFTPLPKPNNASQVSHMTDKVTRS